MWIMVVITFSVVGFFTARSTFGRLAALINPEAAASADATAIVKEQNNDTPLDLLGESAKDVKANLSDLLTNEEEENNNTKIVNDATPVPPVRLP